MAGVRDSVNIAVLALGGQGGGVLVDWIVALAEARGWTAQSTSVAGVAQRTGATIYYIELVPPDAAGRLPVLAQMPVPGDVDILIAAELMEAGRAVQRGLVTPDRTVVIASTHRTFSVQEKMVPGTGLADGKAVLEGVQAAARRVVAADMQALASSQGSVISASLFGALAGSGALPFEIDAFESVVREAGVGVESSLRALRVAARHALQQAQSATPAVAGAADAAPVISPASMVTPPRELPLRAASPRVQALLDRIRASFPADAWPMLGEGLQKVIDFQDPDYGQTYLDRVAQISALEADRGSTTGTHDLTREAAQWIAVAMAYDDVIRVADQKTRGERFTRVRSEVGADAADVLSIEEYFHPRLEEVASLLPRRLGTWMLTSAACRKLHAHFDQGRRIRTTTLRGFLQLRLVAGLRRWRRASLRHFNETRHLEAWLAQVAEATTVDQALALEMLRCRRLVKGYSDTHARGTSRFDRLMQAASVLRGRPDASGRLAQLRQLALDQHDGAAFERALSSL